MAEARLQGKSYANQEQCRFSSSSLEINQLYPLNESACKAAFAPVSAAPTPAPQVEKEYAGPDVDVDGFLNAAMLE